MVLALAVAPACGKHNEVAVLQHEAVAAAKFYAPQLESLDARVQMIFKRGSTIPATTPGIDGVGARLTEARDLIIQLRGLVTPGADGKSAVEKQAAEAAKNRKPAELNKLVHDTHTALDRGITVINDDLQSVESWIAYYDNKALATSRPMPAPTESPGPGAPPVPGGPAPGAPGAAGGGTGVGGPGSPATGGPGAAAGGNTPAPAPGAPAPRAPTPARP